MSFQAIPRERGFFELLERAADGVAAGAGELGPWSKTSSEPRRARGRIQELEHRATS